MLKISYVGYLGLSPAISAQFAPEMCVAVQNRETFTNPPFWGFKSFKVIDFDTPKKPAAGACYDRQHVCAYLQPFLGWTTQ